jgi:hypothetical protein
VKKNARRRSTPVTTLLCLLLLAACDTPSGAAVATSSPATAPPFASPTPEVSVAEVTAAVEAASSATVIPVDLIPRLEEAANDTPQLSTDHCTGPLKFKDSWSGECTFGDPRGAKTVVLFGDSHAGMWSTSLDLAGRRGGWRLRVFEQDGCPAPRITFFKDGVPNAGCNDFREAAIAAIVASKPDVVVVTSATYYQRVGKDAFASAEEWQAGLSAVLRDLKASGARLIVLGDEPVLAQSAPECLAAHQQDVERCATPRETALQGVYQEAEQAAAAANGATYVDPTPWLCTKVCSPIIGRMLVYRNRFHITATYAAFLSGAVRAAIGPL